MTKYEYKWISSVGKSNDAMVLLLNGCGAEGWRVSNYATSGAVLLERPAPEPVIGRPQFADREDQRILAASVKVQDELAKAVRLLRRIAKVAVIQYAVLGAEEDASSVYALRDELTHFLYTHRDI